MAIKRVKETLILATLLVLSSRTAQAQITPAADGVGTQVTPSGQQIEITGGTQAGSNLFHSFQRFGVNQGQTANFLSQPSIQNILGRVTGGEASYINGLIQVTGGNANLFLLNPAGIVFGVDARLNVPRAFTATTAQAIGFGNGWFNASGGNDFALLTGNPDGFAFLQNSGTIFNAGNLSVSAGQSLSLIGGTVVNTGTIAAPGGIVTIAAVPGEKLLRVSQAGSLLSLELAVADRSAINPVAVTPLSLPELLTGGGITSANGVTVEHGVVKLTRSNAAIVTTPGSAAIFGVISADAIGTGNGGKVTVWAADTLNFGGKISAQGGALGGDGGWVDTSGLRVLTIAPTARVNTAAAKGRTGTWLIDPADLNVVATGGTGTIAAGTNSVADSTIDAATIVAALDGTNVTLQATNSITVDAAIDASANLNPGNLSLDAGVVTLNQPIILQPGATLSGTASIVNVTPTGRVGNGVDVARLNGTVNLGAGLYADPGTIIIRKDIIVTGTGANNTIVSGSNLHRVVQINNGVDTAILQNLTIANGSTTNSNGAGILNNGFLTLREVVVRNHTANGMSDGGGLFNARNAAIVDSTFSDNLAGNQGGAIGNAESLSIIRSTISNNRAQSLSSPNNGGGGIHNAVTGSMIINVSTISGNQGSVGGGIRNEGAIVSLFGSTITANTAEQFTGGIQSIGQTRLESTIIAGNFNLAPPTGLDSPDVLGAPNAFVDNGYNLIGIRDSFNSPIAATTLSGTAATPLNPLLTALGDFGGSTQTHALLLGSPAIGGSTNINFDQRGIDRDSAPDIGAVESRGFTIAITGNPTQTTTVAAAFANPLAVMVIANDPGVPVAGAIVTYTPATSAATATLSSTTATTNALGQTSIPAIASSIAGTHTLTATATGVTGIASFTLTNTPDVPANIVATGGSGQSTTVNTAFASALQVVVRDRFGNLVPGATVSFATPASGTSGSLGSPNVVTNATGSAAVAIAANTIAGSFTATANVLGVTTPATFSLTNNPGAPANVTPTAGTPQNTVIGTPFATPLQVQVTDAFGNPIANSSVSFSVPATGASGQFGSNGTTTAVVTDANGVASVPLTANTAIGNYISTGQVSGVTNPAIFSLSNSVGAPASLTILDNPTQSTTVNTDFTSALRAIVRDSAGNPVSNTAVTFSVPTMGASGRFTGNTTTVTALSDGAGIVTVPVAANTIAGSYTAIGNLPNVETIAFNLSNTAGVPATVNAIAGNNQTAVTNTAFGESLRVQVQDAFGNSVSGAAITFITPANGASGQFNSLANITTDALGIATAPSLTANDTSGRYTIAVSTTGFTVTPFTLTNTAPPVPSTQPVNPAIGDNRISVDLQGNPIEPLLERSLQQPNLSLCAVRRQPNLTPDEYQGVPECPQNLRE